MAWVSHSPTPSATEVFAHILFRLRGAVFDRVRKGLPNPLAVLIDARLQRIRARFAALAAKFLAGTLTPPRARPAGACARAACPPRAPDPLPRRFGWLLALVPNGYALSWPPYNAVVAHHQLHDLLRDSDEMRAMIAADARFGRVLRPLLHMLGLADATRPEGVRTRRGAAALRAAASADPLPAAQPPPTAQSPAEIPPPESPPSWIPAGQPIAAPANTAPANAAPANTAPANTAPANTATPPPPDPHSVIHQARFPPLRW
jgi:hypothetical protein